MKQEVDTSWVNDSLLDAVKMTESGGNHYDNEGNLTKSRAGALGAYQWMPKSAADPGYGVKGFDPTKVTEEEMREKTRQYLVGIHKHNPTWSPEQVLQAYNWGAGNVDKVIAGKIKSDNIPKEAKEYSGKVFGFLPQTEESGAGAQDVVPKVSTEESYSTMVSGVPELVSQVNQESTLKEVPAINTNQQPVEDRTTMSLVDNLLEGIIGMSELPLTLAKFITELFAKHANKSKKEKYKIIREEVSKNFPEKSTYYQVPAYNQGIAGVPPIHYLSRGTDTVPAMLTPGEAVIPMEAAQHPAFKPIINQMINTGRAMQNTRFYNKGTVNATPVAHYGLGDAAVSAWDWASNLFSGDNVKENFAEDISEDVSVTSGNLGNRVGENTFLTDDGELYTPSGAYKRAVPPPFQGPDFDPNSPDLNLSGVRKATPNDSSFTNDPVGTERGKLLDQIMNNPNMTVDEKKEAIERANQVSLTVPRGQVSSAVSIDDKSRSSLVPYGYETSGLDAIGDEAEDYSIYNTGDTSFYGGNEGQEVIDNMAPISQNVVHESLISTDQNTNLSLENTPDGKAIITTKANYGPPGTGSQGEGEKKFDVSGAFDSFLGYFDFDKKDVARLMLYYVGGRMTGGSHNGSLRWAGAKVLQDVEKDKELAATTARTRSSTLNQLKGDWKDMKGLFNIETAFQIEAAMNSDRLLEAQKLIEMGYADPGKYMRPIALVADLSATPRSIKLVKGNKEFKAYPSSKGDTTLWWYQDGDKLRNARIGPGQTDYMFTSTDTLDNLRNAASDWYKKLSGKWTEGQGFDEGSNKALLDKAFGYDGPNGRVVMDEGRFESEMSAFANRHGLDSEYVAEELGNAVLTAVGSGLIPEGMTLTGFLEWNMYEEGRTPSISKIVFKTAKGGDEKTPIIQEEIMNLRKEIPNINEVIRRTDSLLVSKTDQDPNNPGKEPIIFPGTGNINDTQKIHDQIRSYIVNNTTYKEGLSEEQKTKIDGVMENLNPYIALLYLNKIRMDKYEEMNKDSTK